MTEQRGTTWQGNKRRLTVLLDPDQAEYVDRKAERERSSITAVIRRAVDRLMQAEPDGEGKAA